MMKNPVMGEQVCDGTSGGCRTSGDHEVSEKTSDDGAEGPDEQLTKQAKVIVPRRRREHGDRKQQPNAVAPTHAPNVRSHTAGARSSAIARDRDRGSEHPSKHERWEDIQRPVADESTD